MRTQDEIKEAINRVKANKEKYPEYSMFGDNNWEAADAALDVLDDLTTDEDEIYDKELDSNVESEAIVAIQWLNEELELEDWLD